MRIMEYVYKGESLTREQFVERTEEAYVQLVEQYVRRMQDDFYDDWYFRRDPDQEFSCPYPKVYRPNSEVTVRTE